MERIQTALEKGDARLLLDASAERLELNLLGTNGLYSRSQAQYVMQNFFRQYPPKRFSFQERTEAQGSQVGAGYYWHEPAEQPLWVFVMLRDKDGQPELREIRIERRLRE